MRRYYFIFIVFIAPFYLAANSETSFLDNLSSLQEEKKTCLIINNRPLAKVNGKIFSLLDIVKHMDLALYEYDPSLNPSPIELYHYYTSRWEITLEEMIANQLILLDAKTHDIEVSEGEIRQELEKRFGPNIIGNLNKMHLSYEEARDMIRTELIIAQLVGFKVHAKALQTITPEVIKKAYATYLEKNPPEHLFTYRVISIRGKDKQACTLIAQAIHTILKQTSDALDHVIQQAQEKHQDCTIALSNEFIKSEKEMSKDYIEALAKLDPSSYSQPISQVSRFDGSTVMRIFYLKSHTKKDPDPLETLHDSLKNDLLNECVQKEKKNYVDNLKKRFGYDQVDVTFPLPDYYTPFSLS